jgi:hypothetical protein
MTAELQNLIVDYHNKARSLIATGPGTLGTLPTATKMNLVQWDNDLAYLAELNVKQCAFAHDKCRGTPKFPYAGQNLAIRWSSNPTAINSQVISFFMSQWFAEYKDVTPSQIQKNPSSSPKLIGHFTAMVIDKTKRVGCGMTKHVNANGYNWEFGCDYSFTNIIDQPVYEVGTTASKCSKGKSSVYQGLCNE